MRGRGTPRGAAASLRAAGSGASPSVWRLAAAVILAASVEPAAAEPDGAAGECLAGAEAAGACPEEQVEADEEALTDRLRVELLQQGARIVGRGEGRAAARGAQHLQEPSTAAQDQAADEAVALSASRSHEERGGVDCALHPMFCAPKLNCAGQPLTPAEREGLGSRLASRDGRANLRSWCAAYPKYASSVQKCIVDEDLAGYARAMYESQKQLKLLEPDAAYCFAVGHCNNTALAASATLEQAEAFCDQQYGHAAWTSIGWNQMHKVMDVAQEFVSGEVPTSLASWAAKVAVIKNMSSVSALTACAMGNLHCDVQYCQQNFCGDTTYRARFGNLSWAL